MKRHSNWDLAEEILARVIPGAGGFDPAKIPGLTRDSWEPFQIYDRDPRSVNDELLQYCQPIVSGVLVIATFQSLTDFGPFFVHANRLRDFLYAYGDIYDDVPVSADTILVSPATNVVVVVHHSELIATVRGPKHPVAFDLNDS
jgi:hypothetical protein